MTHKESQKRHTLFRLKQIHHIDTTPKGYNDLVKQIHTGQSEYIKERPGNASLHIVKHKLKPIPTIYDKTTGAIATVIRWGHFNRISTI